MLWPFLPQTPIHKNGNSICQSNSLLTGQRVYPTAIKFCVVRQSPREEILKRRVLQSAANLTIPACQWLAHRYECIWRRFYHTIHPIGLSLLRCPASSSAASAFLICRPLPLAQLASSATGGARIAPPSGVPPPVGRQKTDCRVAMLLTMA